MKKCKVFVLFVFLIWGCAKKEGIKELIDKIDKQESNQDANCNCGKTYKELLNLKEINDTSSIENLFKFVGKPDTTYNEIAVFPCTSFVYNCEKKFISFHFNKKLRYLGRSYGEINSDGVHEIIGTGRVLDNNM